MCVCEATLQVPPSGKCVLCTAAVATLDGLLVRGPLAAPPNPSGAMIPAIYITAGAARLQECDISTLTIGVVIASGADPVLFGCR